MNGAHDTAPCTVQHINNRRQAGVGPKYILLKACTYRSNVTTDNSLHDARKDRSEDVKDNLLKLGQAYIMDV